MEGRRHNWLISNNGNSLYCSTCTAVKDVEVDLAAVEQDEKEFLVSETGGRKEVKEAQYSLIPPRALRALAEVYGRGAKKYERHNWARGYDWSASHDALLRHIQAFWDGKDYDDESGQHHLAHAAWHCFTLYVFSTEPRYSGFDNRYSFDEE